MKNFSFLRSQHLHYFAKNAGFNYLIVLVIYLTFQVSIRRIPLCLATARAKLSTLLR